MAVMSHCSLYQIQRGRGVGERLLLCASLDPKHPHVSAWSIPMFAAKKKKKKMPQLKVIHRNSINETMW